MNQYNVENLTPFKSKWNSSPTKLVRIPVALEDQILAFAHDLDSGNIQSDKINNSLVTERLKQLIIKIENKETGYKNNGASQLIKELRALLD
ncbi:MAG: hypothetical protein IGQ45_03380 [Cyanobacterium sp. T60_A2020_053]|nr:hypothetical protein [Cyanobacterium sp. T60_A2020_053]MBF2056269.1 hypothetical protein [Cyanobacterium sp. T60_A2020_053]